MTRRERRPLPVLLGLLAGLLASFAPIAPSVLHDLAVGFAAGGTTPRTLSSPPVVLAVDPAPASIDVVGSSQVTVSFDRPMDPTTFDDTSVQVIGERHGPYDGAVSYTGIPEYYAATFAPTVPFLIGERIRVLVTSRVRAATGDPLYPPFSWTFSTECQPGLLAFSVDSTYVAARLPFELYMTDVNRDLYDDFAIAYTPSAAGTLGVFTNLANGSLDFAVTSLVRTTKGPRGIHCGDFNGDRWPDITMTATQDSTFLVLMNNQGTFSDTTKYKFNMIPYNIYGHDLDADGDMDITTGNILGPQVILAYNDGTGAFGSFSTIMADSSPRNMEAADLDGDGDLDFVVVNPNGKVSVFDNIGAGVFGPDTTYPVGYRPLSLYINDLNGDHALDIAVSNVQGGSLSLLFNRGDGTFGEDTVLVVDSVNVGPGKNTLFDVCGNDFDGDGDIDLATADWYTGRLFVLTNDGGGRFAITWTSDTMGVGLQGVISGDLDRDGDADLVVTNWANGRIFVMRNGSATPAIVAHVPEAYRADGDPSGPIQVRFSTAMNGNTFSDSTVFLHAETRGRFPADLSYLSSERTLVVSPLGTFLPGEEVSVVLGPGIQPVVGPPLTPYSWRYLAATAAGGTFFQTTAQVSVPSPSVWPILADLDENGLLDLVVVTPNPGTVVRYVNQGFYVFSPGSPESFGGVFSAAAPGDFDRDGDVDLAVADSTASALRLLTNTGAGFSPAGSVAVSAVPHILRSGDFDNDGTPDVVGTTDAPPELRIWLSQSGSFVPAATVPLSSPPRALATLDHDEDGDLDVAVLCPSPAGVSVFRNSGTASVALDTLISLSLTDPLDLEVGDLTGDGSPDLAIADEGGSLVEIIRSAGAGKFAGSSTIPLSLGPLDIRLADLNGDALLDIASVSADDQSVTAVYNRGGGVFGVDSIYAAPFLPSAVVAAEFSGNGRQDILLSSANVPSLVILANDPPTSVETASPARVTRLLPARPNPANPSAEVAFDLAERTRATLRVYNVQGGLVRTLFDGERPAGGYRVAWDGRDDGGRRVASGVYLVSLEAGRFRGTGRLVLLR